MPQNHVVSCYLLLHYNTLVAKIYALNILTPLSPLVTYKDIKTSQTFLSLFSYQTQFVTDIKKIPTFTQTCCPKAHSYLLAYYLSLSNYVFLL
ncbi:MAG: hypothetical protein N3A01_08200 [Bacteroidales bacterium]|nr:hypothetical protein [Bacteroidales bacterium]